MPLTQIEKVGEFKAPNRKPWLFLLTIIAIGVAVYWFFLRNGQEPDTKVSLAELSSSDMPVQVLTPNKQQSTEPPPSHLISSIEKAEKLVAEEYFLDARNEYLSLLKTTSNPDMIVRIEKALGKVNIELVMTPRRMPEKQNYLVKPGNSVDRIAKRFGTTVELTQINNNLANPNLIKAGDRFRVFTGKFALRASKSNNDLLLTMNDSFFKRYSVGMGKYGKTPAGTFKISDKIKNPPWWRPDGREIPFGDPENILGTRWMEIRATGDTEDVRGYGIHGTTDESSIGKSSSAGCIRMKNSDVEELFVLIPRGTPVTIVE